MKRVSWAIALAVLCGCGSIPLVYESNQGAAAQSEVSGRVIYRIHKAAKPGKIERCYLQHGFGVSEALVRPRAFSYDSFVDAYYGPELIPALLDGVCSEVVVGVQESIVTSILEMTRRTERFLRDVVCRSDAPPGRFSCAYIGHSKGGAVAYNVARRCMQQTSEMGSAACGRLGKVFSASGVVQGALLTFTALGAYKEKDTEAQGKLSAVLGTTADAVVNIYEDYVPGKTNPVWMDLSPAAPLEDGMPIFLANQAVLQKTGWFRGDFASLASDFEFAGASEGVNGCGEGSGLYFRGCRAFGESAFILHAEALKKTFEAGVQAMKEIPSVRAFMERYSALFTWERQQQSDGLADFHLAHDSCVRGLSVPLPLRAVTRCAVIRNLNHWASAGGGPEARAVILEELRN